MPETATRTRPEADIECPTCGAPAETGQLICLECGSRIALGYRRPPGWRLPVAIVSLVVLAAAGGIYFGVQALQDDADVEVAAQPEPPREASGAGGGGAGQGDENAETKDGEKAPADDKTTKKEPKEETPKKKPDTSTPAVGAGGVRSWPEGEDAYTVVILSSEDRGSARGFAQSAAKAGTPAGVLRADDYPSLSASTGFFIVFVGTYPGQVKADQAAARLGRSFAGAYPQFVDGSKARR